MLTSTLPWIKLDIAKPLWIDSWRKLVQRRNPDSIPLSYLQNLFLVWKIALRMKRQPKSCRRNMELILLHVLEPCYLSYTRPDITYTVVKFAKYTRCPEVTGSLVTPIEILERQHAWPCGFIKCRSWVRSMFSLHGNSTSEIILGGFGTTFCRWQEEQEANPDLHWQQECSWHGCKFQGYSKNKTYDEEISLCKGRSWEQSTCFDLDCKQCSGSWHGNQDLGQNSSWLFQVTYICQSP